jgi:hypothetical protein
MLAVDTQFMQTVGGECWLVNLHLAWHERPEEEGDAFLKIHVIYQFKRYDRRLT